MPYRSKRQAAFIHAEAERGTPWAKKFVADSHGTHVQPKKEAIRRHLKRKKKRRHHG